jgi:hypothetical protein
VEHPAVIINITTAAAVSVLQRIYTFLFWGQTPFSRLFFCHQILNSACGRLYYSDDITADDNKPFRYLKPLQSKHMTTSREKSAVSGG